MMKFCATALAAVSLTACQTVSSQHVNFGSSQVAHGLQYAAPKALMKVELVAINNALQLKISQPFLIGDPEATYVLSTTNSPLSDNKYVFIVNPYTRLLTYVNSVNIGRADDILASLAKSVGGLSTAGKDVDENTGGSRSPSAAPVTIYSTVIDPLENCEFGKLCGMAVLNQELHARGMFFLGCGGEEKTTKTQCDMLRSNRRYFDLQLDPMFEQTGAGATASSCSSSICYRAPAPYLIRARVGGVMDESKLLMLPNKAPVMALDLPTGVFANAKSRVDLVHGMPATVVIQQDSELLEIVSIPLNLIEGFFGGVAQVIRLRVNYDTNSTQLIESTTQRENAEAAYRTRRVQLEQQVAAAKAELKTVQEDEQLKAAPDQHTKAIQTAQEKVTAAEKALVDLPPPDAVAYTGEADRTVMSADETRTFQQLTENHPDAIDPAKVKESQEAVVTLIDVATDQPMIGLDAVLCRVEVCEAPEPPQQQRQQGGQQPSGQGQGSTMPARPPIVADPADQDPT